MSGRFLIVVVGAFWLADGVAVVAVCVCAAFAMVIVMTMPLVDPVVNEISNHTGYDAYYKQNCKDYQCLIGNHRKHNECFVS
jgi:hypothetical protein